MKKLMITFILCIIFISCNYGRYPGPYDICEYEGELCDYGHLTYYYCYARDDPYWTYWYEVYVDGGYDVWYNWSDMYDYYCK